MEPSRPWSAPIRVDDVPEGGLFLHIAADEAARERIARLAGLAALPRLDADFTLARRGRGLHVAGTVSATVGQICVVTLDPVENEIAEAVDLVFAPVGAGPVDALGEGDRDAPAAPALDGAAEPPDPLDDDTVDLGAIATEFLLLGIDPYPRKPGAVFDPPRRGGRRIRAFCGARRSQGRSARRRRFMTPRDVWVRCTKRIVIVGGHAIVTGFRAPGRPGRAASPGSRPPSKVG